MNLRILGTFLLTCCAFGQAPEGLPKFEVADAHASAKNANVNVRTGPVRAGRYEMRFASMLDLVRIAYNYEPDKVLGGPNWLEWDRFDIVAKVPSETTPETQKLMLQSLLQDRFKLVVHKENKTLPAYALVVGKKLLIKEADGTGETGCKGQGTAAVLVLERLALMEAELSALGLNSRTPVQYTCRNMTMATFAAGLRGMAGGTALGPNPVQDQTNLKGAWNFDLKWMPALTAVSADSPDRISIFEAVEKQLGLKLEEGKYPIPVLMVDSVNRKPTDNLPNLAELLPPIHMPGEFEVASVKLADPAVKGIQFRTQAGRLTVQNETMKIIIGRAFYPMNSDQIAGIPKWAETEKYDIAARAALDGPASPPLDIETVAPLLRKLLVDRFKLVYHTEERPVPAYSLLAVKPKLKKADPSERTFCKASTAPANSPGGTRLMTCQNITMDQFAERIQNMAPGITWPVVNSTEIEGAWDFSFTYSLTAGRTTAARPADSGAGDEGAALEPSGGYTFFEAIEKELGLKLEQRKRSLPVTVIDSIEAKPTEN